MTLEVWAMIIAGAVVLAAGLILAWPRFQSASGIDKIFALAPVFEAVPLAIFAMEHLFDAHDLMGAVPKWIPGALFWTYFFGVALIAAAISFILWRCVRLSATLRDANERVTRATDSGAIGLWEWDITHDRMIWDPWMYRLLGIERRDLPRCGHRHVRRA